MEPKTSGTASSSEPCNNPTRLMVARPRPRPGTQHEEHTERRREGPLRLLLARGPHGPERDNSASTLKTIALIFAGSVTSGKGLSASSPSVSGT